MHEMPRPTAEMEANRFAAEFLMPALEIRPQLARIDLAKAALLKRHWKTAMSALIRRARDLAVISDVRYRSLLSQMAQRGFNRVEPVELPREEPSIVDTIIEVHVRAHGYTYDDLGKLVCLKLEEFCDEFQVRPVRRLRLVR
jgi:Zn-dependent peptidase ImmA (M78 family)